MSAHKMFDSCYAEKYHYVDGDKVRVILAPPLGGALLGQLGTIVSWDSEWQTNPFPALLRVRFADGFICFLDKDNVRPV